MRRNSLSHVFIRRTGKQRHPLAFDAAIVKQHRHNNPVASVLSSLLSLLTVFFQSKHRDLCRQTLQRKEMESLESMCF